MFPSPRVLATVRSYGQLIAVLRARVDEAQLTREVLDAASGLQSGYSAKLLAPIPIKNIGPMSLGALLGVLRLALVVVDDTSAHPQINQQLTKRRRAVLSGKDHARTCQATKRAPTQGKRRGAL